MTFLQMSFTGAVMILVITLIRLVAINKLPKKVFLFLWGAVLLRLLVPFSVSSAISIYSMANRNTAVQEVIEESPVADFIPIASSEITPTSTGFPNTDVAQMSTNAVQSDPIPWIFVIWCAGMLACVLFFAISYLKCHFEFQTSLPVNDDFINRWLREHPLRRKIKVRQSDRISAPISYGLFQPVILLPRKIDWHNYKELSYVLTHEYIHIRRFDLLTKLILVFTCCIHWFNPMVWLMYLLFNRDLELACDEAVVKQFGESSKEAYAGALIHMEEKRSLLMPFCNSFSKTAIEERIRAIMKTKKVTVGILAVSVISVVAVIIIFATSGKTEPNEHVATNFDVPEVVLEQAKEYVLNNYNRAIEDDPNISWDHFDYIDWRLEKLDHVYTYENFVDHANYEIYQMSYRFLSGSPEDVLLIGGMTITEDGWVATSDSNIYMVFKREGDALTYHTVLCEDFCSPGDVAFTHGLYFTITGKWIPMLYDADDELSGDVAAMVKSVSEDSVTVDIVEVIADRDNLEAGYIINNPDSEETTWKCNENTIFTFVDWNRDFIDSERPELYWTMDFEEFKKYIESYPEGTPSVPFFFWVENDVVISAWEESWLTVYQDVEAGFLQE